MKKYDVIIIGFGPGGMEAAKVLLQAGKKIAVVNRGAWGGVCLNCGCIPTKMLLGAIEPIRLLTDLKRRKIAAGEVTPDYQNLQTRIKRHIAGLSASVAAACESKGARLIQGTASFLDKNRVVIENNEEVLAAPQIIIATGSIPSFFPELVPDHDCVLDSTDLMFIKKIPESLCIIGAGPIGLELGDFFSALGTRIILVESAPQLAPTEDRDISEILKKAAIKNGYELHLGVQAKNVLTQDNHAILTLANGTIIKTCKALVATGRKADTSGLDLQKTGIAADKRGFITVNEYLEAAAGVHAIGDVNGKILLAHAARQQGSYAARRILGQVKKSYDSGPVPSCIYTHPSAMRAGLTEKQARNNGFIVEISKSEFSVNPIAQAHASPEGFTKAVWVDNKLVGMAAAGFNAAQLATSAELLVAGNYTPDKLDELMIAHPSLAESLAEAIFQKRNTLK